MILSQQIATTSARNSAQAALRYLGKDISYNELRTLASRLSYLYLRDLGTHARVAFFARNCPAYVATFIALTNVRSVCIPVDPDRPPEEILEWLRESKATHVAVTNDLVSRAREILQSGRLSLPLIEIEKKHGGEFDTSFTPPPDNTPTEIDIILVLRTAGNSGKPKYVNFTHKQIQHAAVSLRGSYHMTATDRILTILSWAHPFSFVHGMLLPLLTGATCVIHHGLEKEEFMNFLLESKVTRLVGVPQFFLKLLLTCRDLKRSLPGIKSITVGLGMIPAELRKAYGLLKIKVAQTYGQTEACWTLSMEDTEDQEEHPKGFAGKGLPGFKYKVLNANGDEISGKSQREGMLAVMGAGVMNGYLDREDENKQTLRGTWLYTKDYAQLEGDGETLKLTYLGRKEDVIQRGDHILRAELIDGAMRGVPGIKEGAGFTLKNSKDQWVFGIAVVKIPGSAMTEKQVLEFCTAKLPAELMPTLAVFTDAIPHTPGGSVNRKRLHAQYGSSGQNVT